MGVAVNWLVYTKKAVTTYEFIGNRGRTRPVRKGRAFRITMIAKLGAATYVRSGVGYWCQFENGVLFGDASCHAGSSVYQWPSRPSGPWQGDVNYGQLYAAVYRGFTYLPFHEQPAV